MKNLKLKGLLVLATFMTILDVGLTHSVKDHDELRHWEIVSADPDRIFLTFYGDPTSSRAVTWRTKADDKLKACAEIAKSQGGPGFINDLTRIKAKTETIDLKLSSKNKQGLVSYHSVIFKDLEADTLYAYRVGDGKERWSEWIQFRTASREERPFSFLYFGDAQNEVLSHWSRTIRMAYQTAPNASFALHAGDMINQAHADDEWAGWFKAGGFLHSQWSGVPVAGNHEYHREKKRERTLAMQWRPQFTLPIESELPKELHETVYSVEYQGLQMIVLNSNKFIEEQTPYLKAQLKKKGFRWKVVTFHHSIYSPRRGFSKDNQLMEKEWQPIFEKYNVDLVLQGHDHTYTRGQVPIRKGSNYVKGSFQTMYVTSVSGPKQYGINHDHIKTFTDRGLETVRSGEQTQFFQKIRVEKEKLIYQAYTSTGLLYDQAIIQKDLKTGIKSIEQKIPDIKEYTFENTPGTENSHK